MLRLFSILWYISIIIGIWFMVRKKKDIPADQPSLEPLTSKEKLLIFILCLISPLLLGAVFYYGWKKKLPQQAKIGNRLSFAAFGVFLVIYFGSGYVFVKDIVRYNQEQYAPTKMAQEQVLAEQVKKVVDRYDAEDAADLQAIQDKVTKGYEKAKAWQPDAEFYSYRRVFSVPNNFPDPIIKDADSYYYESKNTKDNYEILFDKTSNAILRIDINPNRLTQYVNRFTDLSRLKVGPKKALEIAMLSPRFQSYVKSHSQYVAQVILNEGSQSRDLSSYWLVNLFDDFGQPHNESNARDALVHIETGKLISQ